MKLSPDSPDRRRNSRERAVAEARAILGDERLVAFLHRAKEDSGVLAVGFLLDSLGSNASLDDIFYDGDTSGYTMAVEQIDDLRFSIAFGCAAGSTEGDGGTWEVEYAECGGVVRCELREMWQA